MKKITKKFYEDFDMWLTNRDSLEKPGELELIRYYQNHNSSEIDESSFMYYANRQILILSSESFWQNT